MKLIVIVTFFVVFGVTRFALADDIVRSDAGKQHAEKPTAKPTNTRAQGAVAVRNSDVHTGKNRFGTQQPNTRVRQNYPALTQPVARGPLAMNVQRTLPKY